MSVNVSISSLDAMVNNVQHLSRRQSIDKKVKKAYDELKDYAIGKIDLTKSEIAARVKRISCNEEIIVALILYVKARNSHKLDLYMKRMLKCVKNVTHALYLVNYEDIYDRDRLMNIVLSSAEASYTYFMHTDNLKDRKRALKALLKSEQMMMLLLQNEDLLTILNEDEKLIFKKKLLEYEGKFGFFDDVVKNNYDKIMNTEARK